MMSLVINVLFEVYAWLFTTLFLALMLTFAIDPETAMRFMKRFPKSMWISLADESNSSLRMMGIVGSFILSLGVLILIKRLLMKLS